MREDLGGPGIREGKELPRSNSKDVDGSIRLDLAAGHFRQAGWISVDLADNYAAEFEGGSKPDVVADIRKLPFPDNYADEARAIHVIEHFYPWETLDLVRGVGAGAEARRAIGD